MTDANAFDLANLAINKESRFIEVCIDQDVRLNRIMVPDLHNLPETDTQFELKDVNNARSKYDEAIAKERVAEQNLERMLFLTQNPDEEKSG